MQLTKNKVATLNYVLTDGEGNILDQSRDGTFAYLHGANNIIPGLENALEGKQAGDEVSVRIEPSEAYGERSLENIQRVSRNMFPPDMEIKAGMQFKAQTSSGQAVMVTVTAVEGEEIIVDGNHPLAGVALHFEVELLEIRDATDEELMNGQVSDLEGAG